MSDDQDQQEIRLADLAALADGSLPPERRALVEARVAGSAELQALLEEQRRALAAVRERDEAAPGRLHAWLRSELTRRAAARRRLALATTIVAAAATALALALVLPTQKASTPTLAQVTRLGAKEPTGAPPSVYEEERSLLALELDGVPYPNWQGRFGWKAVGQRHDRLEGRTARTVFYRRGAGRLAYTIVSGPALPRPTRTRRFVRGGTELRSLELEDRTLVTWRRKGHTCVLSSRALSEETLLTLGAWKARGAIPY